MVGRNGKTAQARSAHAQEHSRSHAGPRSPVEARLRALRRRKFAKNWRGGFGTIEVTNEGRGWHLHAHLLIDADWIDGGQLARSWNAATAGAGYIVKVRDARPRDYLREVAKYVVKGNALAVWSGSQIFEFITAFSRERTFFVFGSLYGKRTQWRDWIASLKLFKPKCECGNDQLKFYSEFAWEEHWLQPGETGGPRPPPPEQHPEFQWEDAKEIGHNAFARN